MNNQLKGFIVTEDDINTVTEYMRRILSSGLFLEIQCTVLQICIPVAVAVAPALPAPANNRMQQPPVPQNNNNDNSNNNGNNGNLHSMITVTQSRQQSNKKSKKRGLQPLERIDEDNIVELATPKPLNRDAKPFAPSPQSSPSLSPSTSPSPPSPSDSCMEFQPMLNRIKLSKVRVYQPYYPARANLNIFIAPETTTDLVPVIKPHFESAKDLYYYIDMTTAMQINDRQMVEFETQSGHKVMFANYDIRCKQTDKPLYAEMVENDKKSSKPQSHRQANKWLWKLNSFRTAEEILSAYSNISLRDLPKSSRDRRSFQQQLDYNAYAPDLAEQAHILDETDWNNVQKIKNIKRDGHGKKYKSVEYVMKVNKSAFIRQCKASWHDAPAIPIVVNENKNNENSHHIEWVKVVSIDHGKQIGISCRYSERRQKWEVRSLCLDKGDVVNKHLLCGSDEDTKRWYLSHLRHFNEHYTDIMWSKH
jgi:hypothetical protein